MTLEDHIIELKVDVGQLKTDVGYIKDSLATKHRHSVESRFHWRNLIVTILVSCIYPLYNALTQWKHQ